MCPNFSQFRHRFTRCKRSVINRALSLGTAFEQGLAPSWVCAFFVLPYRRSCGAIDYVFLLIALPQQHQKRHRACCKLLSKRSRAQERHMEATQRSEPRSTCRLQSRVSLGRTAVTLAIDA